MNAGPLLQNHHEYCSLGKGKPIIGLDSRDSYRTMPILCIF